ncbi:MAG: hypothetical protein Q7S53_02990 [bacterium]|nr:hypothetical protein [bacterium]
MNPEQPQAFPSLEKLKEIYKHKLDDILNKSLTVENIGNFADEALEDLVTLIGEILTEYKNNIALEPNLNFNLREQEDDAFKKLELLSIQDALQRVIEVKDQIADLKSYLDKYTDETEKIIIPPEHNANPEIRAGSGQGMEDKKLIPRLLTLLYILETDFDIKKEQIKIVEGKVTLDMVRKTPYVRVEVPDMGRIVYLCDEEGNASYVFDADKLEEGGIPLQDIDISDKRAINDFLAKHPGLGARIIQTKYWRTNIAELLANPIPEKAQEDHFDATGNSERPFSEFAKKEKKEFLPFDNFQQEVRSLYPGEGRIIEWYKVEKINHSSWPATPYDTYKDKGWLSWPELVGKETRYGKEYPSFIDFQAEVRDLYPGKGEIEAWYRKEKAKHSNWHSAPNRIYKDDGWIGWPELVGTENKYKKEHLSFVDFQAEVRALYSGSGSVIEWYAREKEKHPNWYSNPQRTYKDEGWQGWPELGGIENVRKKEYPSFQDFQVEVRAVYVGKDNVREWYEQEKLKHSNWPAKPNIKYRKEGWQGWPELVGRENRSKKEFLSFDDFQAEVRALYPGKGNVQKWYFAESPQHENWPSNPPEKYKVKGWESWPKLVGKNE